MSEAGLSKNQPKDFDAPIEKSEKSKTEEEILYLRNKRDELLAEQQELISSLHAKDENFSAESFLISNINILTNDYFKENKKLLHRLSQLSLNEIDEFIDAQSDDDYKRETFLYYYKKSREMYERVFKYFEHLNDQPEYLFSNLMWILDVGFNIELFVYTKKRQNCRGAIFNLESNFGYKNRMGMLLTPLAFKSSEIFFNTLFHELAHRVYYIELYNEGVKEINHVEHEWYAYYFDKFLQYFFPIELNWLDDIFEEDIFKSAEETLTDNPFFLQEIFQSSTKDIEDIYFATKSFDESEALYPHKKLKKKYFRAIKATEIPRNYSSITEYVWFFNEKLVSLYRAGSLELEMVNWIILMLLIIYSRQYEQKYHGEDNMIYNNIIFTPVGDLDETGVSELKQYASTLIQGYEVE